MKAYSIDLRKRIVEFVKKGGRVSEAVQQFQVAQKTVYRYLSAARSGNLAPKRSWGGWRKLDPDEVRREVEAHPGATLRELAEVFGVSAVGVWHCLKRLQITLKKSHSLSGTERGTTVALSPRTRKTERQTGIFPRRKRR